jgi:hypothetical protein
MHHHRLLSEQWAPSRHDYDMPKRTSGRSAQPWQIGLGNADLNLPRTGARAEQEAVNACPAEKNFWVKERAALTVVLYESEQTFCWNEWENEIADQNRS